MRCIGASIHYVHVPAEQYIMHKHVIALHGPTFSISSTTSDSDALYSALLPSPCMGVVLFVVGLYLMAVLVLFFGSQDYIECGMTNQRNGTKNWHNLSHNNSNIFSQYLNQNTFKSANNILSVGSRLTFSFVTIGKHTFSWVLFIKFEPRISKRIVQLVIAFYTVGKP